MFYGRSCIGGVHVFRMAYLSICCVLQDDILTGMFFLRVCDIVEHMWIVVVMSFMTGVDPVFQKG